MRLISMVLAASCMLLGACGKKEAAVLPAKPSPYQPVATGEVINVKKNGFTLKDKRYFFFVTLENKDVLKRLKKGQKVTILGTSVTPTRKGGAEELEMHEIVLEDGSHVSLY